MIKRRGKRLVSCVSVFEVCLIISMSFTLAFFLKVDFVSADPPSLTTPGGSGSSAFAVSGGQGRSTGSFLSGSSLPEGSKILTGPAGTSWENGITLNNADKFVSADVAKGIAGKPVYAIQNLPDKGVNLLDKEGSVIAKVDASKVSDLNSELSAAKITATPKEEFSVLGNNLGTLGGFAPLLTGLMYAGIAVGAIQLLGGLFGLSKGITDAATMAAFAGIMTWKGLASLGPSGFDMFGGQTAWVTRNAGYIGIGVAVLVFILMYKEEKTKTVMFQCLPYEPPLGGTKCEECNKDPFRPCSEYRCRALGQTCELLNKDNKGKEVCARVDPKDVNSPTITPWNKPLYPVNLRYVTDTSIRPPALGVKIVSPTANGCLQAFTPLKFGITTNKPSQCKIDYNHTKSFKDMQYYFGEENYFLYNHTQSMRLPSPELNGTGSPLLRNDGTFSLYVRCQDANGNENVDEYSVSFCVDKSPDTTPPVIEKTSITSGSPVGFNSDLIPIQVFTDEPADCKWSSSDKAYTDMENAMTCSKSAYNFNSDLLFACNGNLTGIKNRENNKFYFRCRDNPGKADKDRNTMTQSYPLVLRGSELLNIDSSGPNGTITGSTSVVSLDLAVKTSNGADEGKAICYFSTDKDKSDSFIAMVNSNSFEHTQPLSLTNGNYKYYFRCIDAGGNAAYAETSFTVSVDKNAPMVTRVYRDTDALKIVTNEDAECTYSLNNCNFKFDEGIKLIYSGASKTASYAEWKPSSTYYIKCRDAFGNEPNPNECSIIASAMELSPQV